MNGNVQAIPFRGGSSAPVIRGFQGNSPVVWASDPIKKHTTYRTDVFDSSATPDLYIRILADQDIQIPSRKKIQAPLVNVEQQLRSMRNLRENWDGLGVAAPNAMALRVAQDVRLALHEVAATPTEIGPSVEEGITFSFVSGDRYAFLEIYNDGDIAVGYFKGDNEPETYEYNDSFEQIRQASVKVVEFINGNTNT